MHPRRVLTFSSIGSRLAAAMGDVPNSRGAVSRKNISGVPRWSLLKGRKISRDPAEAVSGIERLRHLRELLQGEIRHSLIIGHLGDLNDLMVLGALAGAEMAMR